MPRRFIASLVAFVGLSIVGDSGAPRLGVVTGTVAAWQPGASIAVENDQTNPGGFPIALRNTVYEGDPAAIKPGVRVTVWYKSVGERRPVAAKVRVLADSTGLTRLQILSR